MRVSDWCLSSLDWAAELSSFKEQLSPALGRAETRRSAGAFIDGLLSGIERKTGWMMAEQAGDERPYRLQSLLGRSRWDADCLRDLVRDQIVSDLGGEGSVLVIDETGFLKKGTHSVGVGRQYSGTAGRIENSQIGVFLSLAGRYGHALIDRRLYLPKAWAEDGERRRKAGVPEEVAFATKPVIAREMVEMALESGVSCDYVLADTVYGSDSKLRRMLEQRRQPYILAVRSNHTLRFLTDDWELIQTDPADMAAELDENDWHTLSAGEGTKGQRLYRWARIPLSWTRGERFERWMLVRQSLTVSEDRAYFFAFAPEEARLADLAAAAGLRWTIEECFLRAKEDLGLDHCEARSWHGWHRHITLVMAAAAFLAKLSADQRRAAFADAAKAKPNKTSP